MRIPNWLMALSFWLAWGGFAGCIPGMLLAQYEQALYHWFPRIPSLAIVFVVFDAACGIAYAYKGFRLGMGLRDLQDQSFFLVASGIAVGAGGTLYCYTQGGVFATMKLLCVTQVLLIVEYVLWYKYAASKAAALRRLLQDSENKD